MRRGMFRSGGFTLVEMAVVVAVIALLLGSFLVPLATQIEERRMGEIRRTLDEAREALIGFAMVNGRLPCPASPASNGVESPAGGGACTHAYNGFLPAATLGVTPTDAQGYAVDPWGHRIRYAVTTANGWAFTSAQGLSTQFLTGTLPSPDLQVCSTAAGVTGAPASCAAGAALATSAPAVIYSTGANSLTGGTLADEAQNPNPNSAASDRLFVSRTRAGADAGGGEFDDVVIWISPHILYNRMVAAGKLP